MIPHRARAAIALCTALAVAPSCRGAAASGSRATVARKPVEDVFLLTGEVRAVRVVTLVTPRSEGELQIRWMVEDGSDVSLGDRIVEFDSSRLVQALEELRLKLRQAENERRSQVSTLAAEGDRKAAAVDKAEVEAEQARVDAAVPRDLRSGVEWRQMQATLLEKQAGLEKARLDAEAFAVSTRSDLEVLRRKEEKARRAATNAEQALVTFSARAPRSGIFLVGQHWQSGPDGPRKLQPGDTVWPGFTIGSIPDPTEMEVAATLSEVDNGRVAEGMAARCILDTYPGRVFEGRVVQVGSIAAEPRRAVGPVAPVSGFPVRVSLARTDALLRPGLSARVEVLRRSWPSALVVPRGAVTFDGQGETVTRARGGATAVQLEACTATECVIRSGLGEGDDVVVAE